MTPTVEEMLRAHPFCRGFDDDDFERLAALTRVETFAKGTFVFRENDAAADLHLITSGVIRLELHAPGGLRTIQTLDGDDVLGLSWIEAAGRWMFDAHVVEDATLLVLDGRQILEQCTDDPMLGFTLTRRLLVATAQRLQATRMRLLDLYR